MTDNRRCRLMSTCVGHTPVPAHVCPHIHAHIPHTHMNHTQCSKWYWNSLWESTAGLCTPSTCDFPFRIVLCFRGPLTGRQPFNTEVGVAVWGGWANSFQSLKTHLLIQLYPDQLGSLGQSPPLSGPWNPGGERGHDLEDVYSGFCAPPPSGVIVVVGRLKASSLMWAGERQGEGRECEQ